MKFITNTFVLIILFSTNCFGQNERRVYSTFDNHFLMGYDTFYNGSDLSGEVEHYNRHFLNSYDTTWGSWTGWSLSNKTDDSTRGYGNQYSAIAGHGVSQTLNYLVGYQSPVIVLDTATAISGAYFTNSTYAFYDMLEGSSFSKKFGGTTGDDQDSFKLIVLCYLKGTLVSRTSLMLADYRFADNSEDYIVDDWVYLDFNGSHDDVTADSIVFQFESSDNGQWGMNTPAFFCMDDFNAYSHYVSHPAIIDLASDTFDNGENMAGGFLDAYLFFPNKFDANWHSWEGWSASTMNNQNDPSYGNQYSAKFSSTNFEDKPFMVSYGFENEIRGPYTYSNQGYGYNWLNKTVPPAPWPMVFYFTNSVYAHGDMTTGSAFSKKFGGVDGTDPDYFRILIDYLDSAGTVTLTDTFYLADFRSSNPDDDYILDEWTEYTPKAAAHRIKFRLESSDNGAWGMNTPAYFCMYVHFETGGMENAKESTHCSIYPNPAKEVFYVRSTDIIRKIEVYNIKGELLLSTKEDHLNIQDMLNGVHIVRIYTDKGVAHQRLIVE